MKRSIAKPIMMCA